MSKNITSDTIIGPYRVVSKIGAGGMGEVYLAEDSRLHRKVALKILPSEMAANQDRSLRDDPRFKELLKRLNLPE